MGFREHLKSQLRYADITVKELASLSGVKKQTLDSYLGIHQNIPSAEAAVKIARALGVSVEYLVTGEEPAVPKDIRAISQNLPKLNKRDRKIIATMVKTMLEQGEKA
jgi:transcriptional regulator with XRE-family HTH domain